MNPPEPSKNPELRTHELGSTQHYYQSVPSQKIVKWNLKIPLSTILYEHTCTPFLKYVFFFKLAFIKMIYYRSRLQTVPNCNFLIIYHSYQLGIFLKMLLQELQGQIYIPTLRYSGSRNLANLLLKNGFQVGRYKIIQPLKNLLRGGISGIFLPIFLKAIFSRK